MTDSARNRKAYLRRLQKGVADAKSGPRMTADPTKASLIRDPATGETFKSTSPKGAKCLQRLNY